MVSAADDALVRIGDQSAVLVVGRVPDFRQPLEIVVDSFLRILVYQPPGTQQRLVRRDRQYREADDVVTHEVMPGVGLGPERQPAQIQLLEFGQRLARGDLGIQCLRFPGMHHRQAHGAKAGDVLQSIDLRRWQAAGLPALVLTRQQILETPDLFHVFHRRLVTEAIFQQRHSQFWVIGRTVIALAVVLHGQLPVAVLDNVFLEGDLGVGDVMRRDVVLDRGAHVVKTRGRGFRQAYEQQSGQALDVHRLEAEAAALEVVTHVLVVHQFAAQVVGPLVIGAHQVGDHAAPLRPQPRASMSADVVKRAHRHVIITYDDDRVAADVDREQVAGLGNLRFDAHEDPMTPEDQAQIALVDLRAQVERRRKAMPRPATGNQPGEIERFGQVRPSVRCCPDRTAIR